MEENNLKNEKQKAHTARIKRLGILCASTAFILIVSTYAWFVGTQEVKVNPFEVKIAGTESLKLSLKGTNDSWSEEISFKNREELLNQVYTLGANATDGELVSAGGAFTTVNWPTETPGEAQKGLVPISSIGEMDENASKMKLFEKSSITPSKGGYRLLASKINNDASYDKQTQKGYVAFDLFVKNITGSWYNPILNKADEEAVYLTYDSAVYGTAAAGTSTTELPTTLATLGTAEDISNSLGIENSVRVAFAQIGRVKGDTVYGTNNDDANAGAVMIQNLKCKNGTGGVKNVNEVDAPTASDASLPTGICRVDNIWEPNDTSHYKPALDYFDAVCKERTDVDTWGGKCADPKNGIGQIATYAIRDEIKSGSVDVYDGLNGYETNVGSDKALFEKTYFTDTIKNYKGTSRPELMTLAPNSITKIRIYIYLEGQDIDNVDLAAKEQSIVVNFGFTKQRMENK